MKELSNLEKNLIDTLISEAERKISSADKTDKEKYILSYKIDTLKNINR